MNKSIVVIGAGVAGIEVASILADMGYNVFIIEKNKNIGGNVAFWHHLFPNNRSAAEVREYMNQKIKVPNITLFPNTEVTDISQKKNVYVVRTNKDATFEVGAVLIATGFTPFDARRKEEYGYGIYDNVITSVDLEKKLERGENITTTQGMAPKRIAFVHCVGSRDAKVGHTYCSKVCCITGVKQAIEMSKMFPDAEMYCFYMDLRMHGLEYERFYKDAQENYNTQFIRGRVSEVSENKDKSIQLKAEDTLSGLPLKMKVDLLVLLVGMEQGKDSDKLCDILHLHKTPENFIQPQDPHLQGNVSSRQGVFIAGTCIQPMTINETMQNARSAALEINHYLLHL